MRPGTSDQIVREALEWFVRLRDEKASDEDRRAFQAWLGQSPSHADAWAHAEALWNRFDIVQPEIEQLRASERAVSRRNLIIGGAVVLAGGSALYTYNREDLFADLTTDVGERRIFTLADNTTVELGSYSALSVNFTPTARHVLLHRGEGFFDVAADAARPFVVNAEAGMTEALGTKFDVKYVGDAVTVTVSEHAVLVRAGGIDPVKVEQGWQVSYGKNGNGRVVQADLGASEAWRQDRIIFQDVPLRRVLAELERYRRGRIVLMDSRIGDIPVTAIFNTRQADGALQTIADTLPVRIFHATSYVAVVYPAG